MIHVDSESKIRANKKDVRKMIGNNDAKHNVYSNIIILRSMKSMKSTTPTVARDKKMKYLLDALILEQIAKNYAEITFSVQTVIHVML